MSVWKSVALEEVATIERTSLSPDKIPGGINYVGLEHIESGGKLLDVGTADAGQLASSKFKFTDQHLLFGKLRPNLCKITCPNFSGVCSTDILPILPGPELDRGFLAYFLRQPRMVSVATSRAVGVNLPRLNPGVLAKFKIPLPPLGEQRRIAAILDQADALRAKRRQALAELNTLTQSIFLQMFGDLDRNGWKMVTVADVAASERGSIRTGPFGSQLLHSEFTEAGIAVLGIDNAVNNEFEWGQRRYISEKKYDELRRYTVKPGDVLITIMGTCGRCAVVPHGIPLAINTKHLCCITLDPAKCLPQFMHAYFLQHPIAQQYLAARAKGAIMSGLNMGIVKELPIPLAPISLQLEFVDRLKAANELRSKHSNAKCFHDKLFRSLQQRGFRGEL